MLAALLGRVLAQFRAQSLKELQDAFVFPKMSVWALYSSLFVSVWVVLFYASLVPILVPFTAIKLILVYFIGQPSIFVLTLMGCAEKYNVLRRYPRPPAMDDRLAKRVRDLLYTTVYAHFAVAFYAFRRPIDWCACCLTACLFVFSLSFVVAGRTRTS